MRLLMPHSQKLPNLLNNKNCMHVPLNKESLTNLSKLVSRKENIDKKHQLNNNLVVYTLY